MAGMTVFDGLKSVRLDDLPPEAWRIIVGGEEGGNETQRLYETVAFLYRCIEVRANAMVALPWAVQRGETDLWSNKDGDIPPELLALADLPDLLWQTEAALCLGGQAFWHRVESRTGRLLEVRWLAPTTMRPVWDTDQGLVAYKRSLPGRAPLEMSTDEVVYIWLRGLHETKPRRSPAEAAAAAAKVVYNTDLFTAGFFERGAIKATLLTVEGNPLPADRERIKSWWRRFMQGVKNAFTAEVVAAAVKPVVVGEGIGELANTALTAEKREDIATAMGVPHSLVLSNASNYATSHQDELNFYNMTIVPQAKLLERQMNRQLFELLGLRFRFRPEQMTVYQEDETQRAQAYSLYVNAGMSPSVAAQILGVDLPPGVEYANLDRQAAEKEQAAVEMQRQQAEVRQTEARQAEVRRLKRWAKGKKTPDVDRFASDILSREEKLVALKGEAATAQPFFPGTITPDWLKTQLQMNPDDGEEEQRIRKELERLRAETLATALEESLRAAKPTTALAVPALAGSVETELLHGRRVRDVLERMLLEAADLGVAAAVVQLETVGLGFDYTLANLAARDWAQAHAGQLIRDVTETTVRGVRQATARWIENKEPLQALIDDLGPLFDPQRARLIAATEVTRAYFEGNVTAWRESSVVAAMEWRTSQDERVCPVCGPLHGRRVPMGNAFEGGLLPPAHPNCRCWAVPVV
jgi:SPP1 gp7 family putative phage head morphogenesis protein